MKSHRVLRNREKHNKRTKRRKKSKKNKMKGGAVITDTTDQQWLVCDNPYCFQNHYNAEPRRDDVFHYEKNEPSGSDKHIIHVKDNSRGGWFGTGKDFYIVKNKINFEDKDEYFYIGDSFQKIRDFKDDNTKPRFEIVGEQNFTESAISSRTAVSHDIIKNKNSSEQYGLSGPQSWENMLLYSVVKLLKTIEYDEKCLPEKEDIQRVLDIINSKGRRIHKSTPDKWVGYAPVADTGLQLLSQTTPPKKFFEAFFGVPDATLEDFTAYTQLVKLDLSFDKDNISTLSTEITELRRILQPYGQNIIEKLNENLKQYYNNRGRVLKWKATDGGIKADQSDLDGTHVVDAYEIEQGQTLVSQIQFYRAPDGFQKLTYGINIRNQYIAWKFKKYYSRVLLKLVKVGCFHINGDESLNKLNYTKGDTDSNPYHKDFSLKSAIAITDAEELLKVDDITAEDTTTEGISDDITQKIYSKIYGADLDFIGDIGDVGSHHSLSKFKTKLNDFRSEDGKNISLKDLPHFLPFFDTADSFNSALVHVKDLYEGIETEGQLSKMLLSNGSVYGDTEDNVRFEYLEHIYQKSSLQKGLCYCDVCKEKKTLNPSDKEELMKIKKGDIFGQGLKADCSKTINDKIFELESKKLLKIYIKKALEQREIRDILENSEFEDGEFYEDGGGLKADADEKIDGWIEKTLKSEGRDDKASLNNREYLMKFLKEHKYNHLGRRDPLDQLIKESSEELDQEIRSSTDLELINTARVNAMKELSELKHEQEKVRNKKNEEDCEEKTKTFKSSLDAIASIIKDADITMDNLEFEKLKDQLDTYKQEINDNELSYAHIRDTNSLDGSRVQNAVIDRLSSEGASINNKKKKERRNQKLNREIIYFS